ncbi:MAG: hypothetical protein NTV51_24100 [Verrucomicrobia bacterium]|nr:hypothetical protein [Verrucomicrobiota bacterium]
MRIIESIAVLLGASAAVAAPVDRSAQKQQLEELLAAARPLAHTMLEQHAEFFPYGATMGLDGKITSVAGDTGDEHPRSREIITLLKRGYREQGASGKLLACALVYDVRVVPPGRTEKTDAIAVDLDHRDGMSVTMYYPYKIGSDKEVVSGEFFATQGRDDIFLRTKPDQPRSEINP